MIWGIAPEVLVSLAINSLILVWLILANARGMFVWKSAHLRELAALEARVAQAIKDRDADVAAVRADRDKQVGDIRAEMMTRMDNFRSDHALRLEQAREDHEKQLAALVRVADDIRADFKRILDSKDRDIDQWRGAWQLTDQAGREEYAAQVDELVSGFRTMQRWLAEWQRATGVTELRRIEDRDAG
jgi:hypothetical protein